MTTVTDEFLSSPEDGVLGDMLAKAQHTKLETMVWYVGEALPDLDAGPQRRPSMWDPGNRVSMLKASLTREHAITNAAFDRTMDPANNSSDLPSRLFAFTVRLDAVLDISTPEKLEQYGLTIPMIASFYDIFNGMRRMPIENVVMGDWLKMVAGSVRKFRGVVENVTRVEKLTAIASALAYDGMLVPGLWHDGQDVIVFYHGWPNVILIAHDTIEDIWDHGLVDLQTPGVL